MNSLTAVVCPSCGGSGNDRWFDLPKCFVCGGLGTINTEVHGDELALDFSGEHITLDIMKADIRMTKDLWDWIVFNSNAEEWWEVHAKFPVLERMETMLIAANEIELSDIPGGPNNFNSPTMIKNAHDFRSVLKELENLPGGEVAYNSYKENVANKNKTASSIRDKIRNAAELTHAEKLKELETQPGLDPVAIEPPDTAEEKRMEDRTVTDRLKGGGILIREAMQEGAILGGVTAANKGMVEFMEFKLGDKYPEALKSEAGRAAVQLAIPSLMLMFCEFDNGKNIPAFDSVKLAAQLAVKGSSAEAVEKAVQFVLKEGMPFLMAYAKAGDKVLANRADNADTITATDTDAEERARLAAAAKPEIVPQFND